MKLIKRVRQFLKSKYSGAKRRLAPKPPREEAAAAPKNGRLTVAVAASVLIMVILGAINIRLIRDPSIAGKAFKPIFSSKPEPDVKLPVFPVKEAADGKACASPTEVTFYRDLRRQDEAAGETAQTTPAVNAESEVKPEESGGRSADSKSGAKKDDSRQGRTVRMPDTEGQSFPQTKVSQADGRHKIYTVQVGAFTHPAIAQEWAQKWKARGYDVSLKPVARPNTGVIYRLYLGNFTCEKKAEDLVKHLKSKEGINAFRLLVRE